jgi:hypothetical protein
VKRGIQLQSYDRFPWHQTGRYELCQNHIKHFTQRGGPNSSPSIGIPGQTTVRKIITSIKTTIRLFF